MVSDLQSTFFLIFSLDPFHTFAKFSELESFSSKKKKKKQQSCHL